MSTKRMSTIFRRSNSTTDAAPSSPTVGQAPASGDGLKALKEFGDKVKKGLPFEWDTTNLAAVLDLVRHKDAIDDRKLLLEHALSFVANLEDGPLARTLRNRIIQLLYNDLTHPAATSISNKYAWRTADGSFNNIDVPDMGKAGTPYSRSVQQSHPLPKNQLPDSGLVFDTLLKREGFIKHPGGLSSLMFAFAALVIHSVFRTSHHDVTINETSSYVDLAPLYGNSVEDQNRIRLRDGFGRLYPDAFSEDRLLLLPPAVCTILILFNRNHNHIATKLLEINERGTYVDPKTLSLDDPASKKQLLAQEEDIFQTARLINCGWFGSVVFSDYFSCILGLVREGSNWSLSPFEEMRMEDHSLFERGKGNVCSVEFNCLYRWHATTSQADERYTESVFQNIFGKPVEEVSAADFRMAAYKIEEVHSGPTQWKVGDLERQADGSFSDEGLANFLHNATERPAGAFRARGTPPVMRLNEIMGIEQNRRWGVCSLNDFRKYLGLKTFDSFLEWNSDPEIARAAELLYHDIDNLELYVGLQAEEAKPLVDGAGLCPGYTISRAILSDAIALTRGDRFFTHDFTPFNLTAWGFQDCQRDPDGFGFENSVYTFFPLMTPDSMKTHLTKLNLLDKYDFSRPKARTQPVEISDYAQITGILKDTDTFRPTYAAKASKVIKGKGFYPAEGPKEQEIVRNALSGSPALVEKIGLYFYDTTKKLIEANSFTLVGGKKRGVDVVRNVLRVLPSIWLANLAGISLKTKEDSDGSYTAEELFVILSDIYSFIFLNVEPAKVMVLQEKVQGHVKELTQLIKDNIGSGKPSISGLISLFKQNKPEHHEIINRLAEASQFKDRDTLANAILAIMVVANAKISLSATNMLDLYLGTDKAEEIQGLLSSKNNASPLKGYAYEALRVAPPFAGVYRTTSKDQNLSGKALKQDDRIFLNIAKANLDAKLSSGGADTDASKPAKELLRAEGVFDYLGEALIIEILSQIGRAIFERNGLSRAPGQSGSLPRFKDLSRPECRYTYLNDKQSICEWPTSLSILYNVA